MITHQPYPGDVSDAEWEFILPYLCLLPEDVGQREHNLRDIFDALRWFVRSGAQWRYIPKDFPPWAAVYQQTRRRLLRGHRLRPDRSGNSFSRPVYDVSDSQNKQTSGDPVATM